MARSQISTDELIARFVRHGLSAETARAQAEYFAGSPAALSLVLEDVDGRDFWAVGRDGTVMSFDIRSNAELHSRWIAEAIAAYGSTSQASR